MHYKRKGHRGVHKRRGITYNQSCRVCGNSESKQRYFGDGRPANVHIAAQKRNRIDASEMD